MVAIVGSGQFTLTDVRDVAPVTVVPNSNKSLQQTYDVSRATPYLPSHSAGDPLTITMVATQAAVGGPVDVSSRLTNIKWGTTSGGNDLSAGSANHSCSGLTMSVLTNAFVDVSNPTKTVYFQADLTDSYTNVTSTVVAVFVLSVVQVGTNATYVAVAGQTTITKSVDADAPSFGVVFASLTRGASLDTTDVQYQWRVGPGFGVDDILDANHALVTAGYVQFKTSAGVAANDYSYGGNIMAAPTNSTGEPGVFSDARGLVINELAVTGQLLLKCIVKDTLVSPAQYFDGYGTVVDKTDPLQVSIASSGGDTLRNGSGSTYIYPKVVQQQNGLTDQSVRNLNNWTFDWFMLNANGSRGAFVTGSKGTITAFDTTGKVFTVSPALSAAPAAGTVIKVLLGTTERYYVVASGSTTTAIKINVTNPQATVEWITTTDYPEPVNAAQFLGGSLMVCTDQLSVKMSLSTKYTLHATSSFDPVTNTYTLTGTPSGIAAGDVIFVSKAVAGDPTTANRCMYHEVLSVNTTNKTVTIKAASFTKPWINLIDYPKPSSITDFNGGALQKVLMTVRNAAGTDITSALGYLVGPGVPVDGDDVNMKANFYVKASKP